jgi:hypothetical protein
MYRRSGRRVTSREENGVPRKFNLNRIGIPHTSLTLTFGMKLDIIQDDAYELAKFK